MNHEIDDEKLIAYNDGELEGAAATEVKAVLLRDPALRRRAEKLRDSAQALRGAFDELLAEPMPTRILDILEDGSLVYARHEKNTNVWLIESDR